MITGLDYSTGKPPAKTIADGGYAFVVRYLSTPGNRKNITRNEFVDLLEHGVAVALVFETTAGRALAGAAAGKADATSARKQADQLGFPVNRPIYFAVDVDITTTKQLSTVDEYLRGVASVLGVDCVGVYGEYDVIEHCHKTGTAAWLWQTRAWSHGRLSEHAHLIQNIGTVIVGGVSCDTNTAQHSDFGQHPTPLQKLTEDDGDMATHVMVEPGDKANLACAHIKGAKTLTAFVDSFAVPGGHVRTAAYIKNPDGTHTWKPTFRSNDDDPFRWWFTKGIFSMGLPENCVGVSISVDADMGYPVDWTIASN